MIKIVLATSKGESVCTLMSVARLVLRCNLYIPLFVRIIVSIVSSDWMYYHMTLCNRVRTDVWSQSYERPSGSHTIQYVIV